MRLDEKKIAELVRKGWLPVDGAKALFINDPLFKKGIISFLDPSNCQVSKIEDDGPFSVSKERSLVFSNDDKSSRKAKQFFNLPATTTCLRNPKKRDECYVPVIVADKQGKVVAGLYIHPRKVGTEDFREKNKPFTAFHTESCLLGAELSCSTATGSKRHFTKHDVKFYEGEQIVSITSSPGDNSYETMQLEELQLMAMFMASYSLKGDDGKPVAKVTHHLPWLDYILSGAVLWHQGHLSYQALHTLCEIMILKKTEHENKISTIYRSLDLAYQCITPFENLLNPTKSITAESILEQLGINEKESEEQDQDQDLYIMTKLQDILKDKHLLQAFFEELQTKKNNKKSAREKAFVSQCITLLTENAFNTEQKDRWKSIIAAKKVLGESIETLENLLQTANALALVIAADKDSSEPEHSNACSLVSTQGKQIQVAYEKLFKLEELKLPPVTCCTSVPLFLTSSQTTQGATFYFEYLPHARSIRQLIDRNIVGGAVSNMVAWMSGQEGKSVKCYLDKHENISPTHMFFRPVAEEIIPEVSVMPGIKTLHYAPGMFFTINGLSEYNPEIDDDPIIIGSRNGRFISDETAASQPKEQDGKVQLLFDSRELSKYYDKPYITFGDNKGHPLKEFMSW